MTRPAPQRGYILLPVIVVITLVAAIALLMTTESALESNTAATELDAQQAQYVAAAGLNHALWQAAQQGCGPYSNITNWALGNDRYSSSLATDLGATTNYTVNVDQDAWIESASPSNNNGSSDLEVTAGAGGVERPLLRYDLSSIPAKASILSARAWFYVTDAHPEGPVDIHAITTDWTEADANWDSMSDNMDSVVLASIPTQAVANVWTSANLTAQVQAWINGAPNFGLALEPVALGVAGVYASREGSNAPYLEVIVGAPPTSPALLKAQGTLANGASRGISRADVILRQQPGSAFLQPDAAAGKDTYLYEWKPTWNYGADSRIWVDDRWSDSTAHGLMQFNLNAIPAGARVTGARLELYQANSSLGGGPVGVYRLDQLWDEGASGGGAGVANWTSRHSAAAWSSPGGGFDGKRHAVADAPPGIGWVAWEIGELVDDWVGGRFNNWGLLLYPETPGTAAHFASSDDTDPALRPKLTVTYACECGRVCVAPQGSLGVLMLVGDDSVLTPGDEAKKDLFESWGHTVGLVNDNTSASGLALAMSAYDVLYVAASANEAAVGSKLDSLAAPVVSEQGMLANEIGFAAGASTVAGDAAAIVDSGHYITRPFAAGPLVIYTHPMARSTVTGAEAAGLQTLADSAGAGSLVLLDAGAIAGGDIAGLPAAGRRVMLPFAAADDFRWDYLNSNGRLLLQRALEWAAGLEGSGCGSLTPLLLVVGSDAPLASSDDGRKTLMESWCYAVTVIDDGASQAEFDAAAAAADVVYVSATIGGGTLADKLTGSPAPVVNEFYGKLDNFGFSSSTGILVSADTFTSTNAAHYISEPFAGGAATVFTSSLAMPVPGGTLAPDLQTVGEIAGPIAALVTLDSGATRWDGNPAPARRVHLPFAAAETSQLTADGEILMRRALEWAATPPPTPAPVAHWKLNETAGATALDSEGGHDGTLVNDPEWTPGIDGGGLAFDGSNDLVTVPHSDDLSFTERFTFLAWIRADSFGAATDYQAVLTKGDASVHNYWFGVRGTEVVLDFKVGGSWHKFTTSGAALTPGRWYHIATTFDNSADSVRLFIDGAEATSDTMSVTPEANTQIIRIGNSAFSGEDWPGMLDDVRIYDRVLSDGDIAALATLPDPIAHWKLDETTGPTAVDSEGDNDGTWANGPVPAPGAIDGGLDFDGSNDYVDAGTFDVAGSGITLMAWFNAEAIATDDGRFVSKASGPNEADAWWQLSTTDSGSDRYLRMRIKAGGTTTTLADSSVNLDTGTWYLAAATYDNASGMMRLYLDGVEVASTTHAVGGALDTNPAVPVALGANGTAERFFNGVLDDVRVYDYALPASAIANTFAATLPPGAASYTELYQPWSASVAGAWEAVGLAPLGVPANAVVEVAIVNGDASREQWGGVRALGSSLERRFLLHEAEGGGVDAVTMHVQADAVGRIEHYSSKTVTTGFILLGYWTGASYVELFEPFDATSNNSWVTEDLSDQGLEPNRVAEVVITNIDGSNERLAGLRTPGSGLLRLFDLHEAEAGGVDAISMMVVVDAATAVEVFAESTADIDFQVVGYWDVPPGNYIESAGISVSATVGGAWGSKDLSGLGIPSASIAQFVISNNRVADANAMGIRASGSTQQRLVELQEAQSGGSDLVTLHSGVGGGSQVEVYAEFGNANGFFYPVGWWVLGP